MLLIALALALGSIGVLGGASVVLTRRWWFDAPVLAGTYGLLGVGLIAQLEWVLFWIGPLLGIACSFVVTTAAIGVVVRARVWRAWRSWAPTALLAVGIVGASLGLALMYGGASQPFVTVAARFRYEPPDNVLQHLFEDALWRGVNTTGFFELWNGSDRPPLQSGLLLLDRSLALLIGVPRSAQVYAPHVLAVAFATSVVAQLLVCVTLTALLRVIGFSRRSAHLTLLFCGVTPVFFRNIIYTWPKLMCAGFALGCVTLLLHVLIHQRRFDSSRFVAAAVLAVLAYLGHGAVAFSAPMFLLIGILTLRLAARRERVAAVAAALLASAAVYLPWQLYGTYRDPFSGRLMKLYFAGIRQPTNEGLLHAMVRRYDQQSVGEIVGARWHNLGHVLNLDPSGHLAIGAQWVRSVRDQDFYDTSWALGWGSILSVGLVIHLLRKRTTWWTLAWSPTRGPHASAVTVLLHSSLASVAFWIVTLYSGRDAIVHQGSYVWIVILLAVPFAWYSERITGLGETLIALSLVYVAVCYSERGPTGTTPLNASGLTMIYLGAMVVIGSFALLRRTESVTRHVLQGPVYEQPEPSAVAVASNDGDEHRHAEAAGARRLG
ncbi:hypothetical protein D9V37_07175 [Nocardioides mangrovicus]|uniref:Glycosyltransferase RgtA/B/C/D-like domain-containing protein n=2 Tax=Nocardioides mangrovicus TaxID=2478913 RepID=A0A3L8P2X7_9ACTN|nr:hypothetical protein D9V37_07175 [Nocardioides mangrovicus]